MVPVGFPVRTRHGILAALASVAMLVSCSTETFFNNVTSLGGDVPGGRSTIQVSFINNTPYRATFTFGVYDPQDQFSVPRYNQYYVNPDEATTDFNRGLAASQSSPVLSFQCGRLMSLGGQEMIDRINEFSARRGQNPLDETAPDPDPVALQPGISFSDKPLNDPEVDVPAVILDAVTTLQGAEFPCDALLIYEFQSDPSQASGIRVDLSVILP